MYPNGASPGFGFERLLEIHRRKQLRGVHEGGVGDDEVELDLFAVGDGGGVADGGGAGGEALCDSVARVGFDAFWNDRIDGIGGDACRSVIDDDAVVECLIEVCIAIARDDEFLIAAEREVDVDEPHAWAYAVERIDKGRRVFGLGIFVDRRDVEATLAQGEG